IASARAAAAAELVITSTRSASATRTISNTCTNLRALDPTRQHQNPSLWINPWLGIKPLSRET
ncbi:hypothetical protein, partial [Mycolicibacterium sp. 018/SC-01/001]|uniref:hypothetical protein n=1 Tax=Mycolicibacterium sp. 018/SC-01/001 TaxID=2592069 RepID=UPI001C8F5590